MLTIWAFWNRWRSGLGWSYYLRFWSNVPVRQVSYASFPSRRHFQSLIANLCSEYYSQCVPGSGGNPPATTTSGGTTPVPTGGATGLHNKFKAKGKLYFGTEIDHYHLNNNPLTTIVKNSFGQITNENSMKWDAIERELLSLCVSSR